MQNPLAFARESETVKIIKVSFAVCASTLLIAVAVTAVIAAQNQPARGGAAAQEKPPPPPAPQPKHPSGALVIWGDVVNFNPPTTPNQCTLQSRFKRGERIGFRMTAIDGGTGETENTAILSAHITYAGKTVEVPMRWRGNVPFPKDQYLRAPNEMWTGGWVVPDDAPIGTISYTVTATDRFGRKATYRPFAAIPSQLAIVN
jgi:hypothetical protein